MKRTDEVLWPKVTHEVLWPKVWWIAASVVLAAASATMPVAMASPASNADMVQQRLPVIAGDPVSLREFFVDLPKGADLHHHLMGAVSAESMLDWLAADGGCLSLVTYQASPPPCSSADVSAAAVATDPAVRAGVIGAWSMRGFVPSPERSGHDHFFATFRLFEEAFSTPERFGDGIAEVANRAAVDNALRIETRLMPNETGSGGLAQALQTQYADSALDPATLPDAFAILQAAGLGSVVADAVAATDRIMERAQLTMACQTWNPDPGCRVQIGLVAETNRDASPQEVFAQLATAFATAAADSRWVAADLVAPEDGPQALDDYRLHMQMVRFLSTLYPQVHVTLHAGELAPGLVGPADLDFHIREAVLLAGTERVGHGVDIRHEKDSAGLMQTMAQRGITVEVALTSNDQILGVNSQASQFLAYREAGVPVVLATDDEGVEGTDLSAQYELAFRWFGLPYAELKKLSYQSVDSAFATPSQRAALHERLDAEFTAFEEHWSQPQ